MRFFDVEGSGQIIKLLLDDSTEIVWHRHWYDAMAKGTIADIPSVLRLMVFPDLTSSEQEHLRSRIPQLVAAFKKFRDRQNFCVIPAKHPEFADVLRALGALPMAMQAGALAAIQAMGKASKL